MIRVCLPPRRWDLEGDALDSLGAGDTLVPLGPRLSRHATGSLGGPSDHDEDEEASAVCEDCGSTGDSEHMLL